MAQTETKLQDILEDHERWFQGEGGERANLQRADLRGSDLRHANLRGSDLRHANLRHANLWGSDLRHANLQRANLRNANLRGANLLGANFWSADLRGADLRNADLRNANLRNADLRGADLSQTRGISSAAEWMEKHLAANEDGYIAYKSFGVHYNTPDSWKIEEGAVLTETVSPNRTIDCACGVNVATREWFGESIDGLWKVLIRWKWLPGVVVPYHTDGKFRCEKVELLENVD